MKINHFALLAALLIGSTCVANTSQPKKNILKSKLPSKEVVSAIIENSLEKNLICTMKCSITMNGVTYTTSSGGWTTSCKTAGEDCLKKLAILTSLPQ